MRVKGVHLSTDSFKLLRNRLIPQPLLIVTLCPGPVRLQMHMDLHRQALMRSDRLTRAWGYLHLLCN